MASTEVDACVVNKGPFATVRDRTMHVIVAVLDLLVKDGNKVCILSFYLFLTPPIHPSLSLSPLFISSLSLSLSLSFLFFPPAFLMSYCLFYAQVKSDVGDCPDVPLEKYLQRYIFSLINNTIAKIHKTERKKWGSCFWY